MKKGISAPGRDFGGHLTPNVCLTDGSGDLGHGEKPGESPPHLGRSAALSSSPWITETVQQEQLLTSFLKTPNIHLYTNASNFYIPAIMQKKLKAL